MSRITEPGRNLSSQLTVGILAGGKSYRFGSPKHLALLDGQSFLDRACRTAGQLSAEILLSCGQQGITKNNSRQIYDLPGLPGPAGGIAALLRATRSPWLLTFPVDMPCLQAQTLNGLFSERLPDRPVSIVAGGKQQPLVTVWPGAVANDFLGMAPLCDYRIKDILKSLNVHYIKIDSVEAKIEFSNINSHQDLQKLQHQRKIDKADE